jgi:hypothetical protein
VPCGRMSCARPASQASASSRPLCPDRSKRIEDGGRQARHELTSSPALECSKIGLLLAALLAFLVAWAMDWIYSGGGVSGPN